MRRLLFISFCALTACLEVQDDPTTLHDLRVLAVQLEPPEVLIPGCNIAALTSSAISGAADGGAVTLPPELQQLLITYASTPVRYTALIVDPKGEGRPLSYRLAACADRGDRDCNDPGTYVDMSAGETTGGEFTTTIQPGLQFLENGDPLLLSVIEFDTFKGLGGIRVPLVLELTAPGASEKIYVQKLMVFTCQFFPEMKQNITPVMPGVTWNGEPWQDDEVKEWQGHEEVTFEPNDFTHLEEPYVVPSLSLQPVYLEESWQVNWHTTYGTMSSFETGGTNLVGVSGRHRSKWSPSRRQQEPQDVEFWFVVRDGRGGQSWLHRRAHWSPDAGE